jgi:tetratricopeptide (TPR) repeat protein
MFVWRLQVLDWAGTGQWRWRWRLLDDKGAYVTDHQVEIDGTAWQFDAFTNLHHYLKWAAAPDRRWAHQAELVEQVGEWVGQHVLGPRIGTELARRRGPVQIEVSADATVLGHLPWELARVNGRTLAGHRTNLVIVPENHDAFDKQPVGERLRMLAVFSLPDGVGALNLRKERVALARLVQRIARVNNKAIELRVLQYGATRGRLEDALEEAEGWDVVHLSGHGLAGGLVLEKPDGRRDVITSEDLVELLDRGRDQIKLVTLSACESAAVTAAEHLRQLGLGPAVADNGDAPADGPAPPPDKPLPAVAAALVAGLDCAVLAMRYPVVDDFAIALTGSFYDLLLGKSQPVAKALALSLTQRTVIPDDATPGTPALSVGTPVLFGPRAADLTLTTPRGQGATIDTDTSKLAEFPDQPVRFVGRVGALTRASGVLADESGRPGVVLFGMAGAGKTACALELAYTHERSFPLMAWFAAPEETPGGAEIRPVLASFALATERQLPDLRWAHLVDDPEKLRGFLPQLTEIMEQNRILLVLDNVESLLTEGGAWRDERWGWVLAALMGHSGLSRVVVTSRRLPVGLPEAMLVEPVHALSLPESVLLARELPRLRGLIDGTDLPAGLTAETGREVAARVLGVVQGHPKLLELADGAAVDPVELRSRLADADAAWLARGTRLDGFLREESSTASDDDFGAVLAGWTRSAAAGLPDEAGLLLRVLCGLEDADRTPNVLEVLWPQVWERAGGSGSAPDVAALLPALAGRALVAQECDPESGAVLGWGVHPGVADAVRADTDQGLAEVVDEVAGDAWLGTLREAQSREVEEREGAWVLRAARSAAPYLLRRGRWGDLDFVAEQVLARDRGVSAAVVLAPMLRVAAEATRGGELELALGRTHARVVLWLDPARGVALLDELLEAAVAAGRYDNASALAGDLANRYRAEGRYVEALGLVDRQVDYSRRAGFGPWTQLADQTQRLQIEYLQGRHREVLDQVEGLRERMATLPADPDPATERVNVWNVRETTLNIGAGAAQNLGLWERALELNTENLAFKRGRGAGAHEQAKAAFNACGSLIRLGRLTEARELLIGCREVFEQAQDILGLGKSLSALADVEDELGHGERAVDLERAALRFRYAAVDTRDVVVSHHNLANYLQDSGADPGLVGAHRVAAAVIGYWIGSGLLPGPLSALGRLLAAEGSSVPRSFGQVCALVGQVPGVDLAGLLARLPGRAPDPDTAVQAVLAAASDAAAAQRPDRIEQALAGWEPVLSALHTAATNPDPDTRAAAATALTAVLDRFADSDDWAALAAVLRRVHTGERDPDVLLGGLDDIDTAIVRRALDILTGTATIDPDAWHTLTDDTANGQDEPDC